ncbi:GvpL/GvpF family gas vesicle protein [Isoptericola sp. NPDC019693]|uniref:GvpL/GvpF family gas vesicle protein n=1 Tax=Isoptericola sp. NPDC019693 TaxID=3364009 RepID=UPI00378A20A9
MVRTHGLYLYGLAPGDARLPSGLTGIAGRAVRAEPLGSLRAVVSEAPDDREVGLPDDVRDHARVLDAVAETVPVLPVQFGTLATAGALDEAVPADQQDRHAADLRALAGLVQMTVSARYREEAVLAELVAEDAEIRRLRERTRGRDEMATYDERIRLGELVVAGFDARRPADAELLARTVEPFARATSDHEVTRTGDVAELALLVRREEVGALEDALEAFAAQVADRVSVRLVGPQAAYDFAEEV